MQKFKPTGKLDGWYYVLDENDKIVGVRGKDDVLRPKRFKTLKRARAFAVRLGFVS